MALPDRPTYNDVRGSFNKYRSIAYGTWKPGEAKRFSEKAKRRLPVSLSFDVVPRLRASSESLDSPTLVPTEDEISEIDNCKTEPISVHQCAQTTPSLSHGKRKVDEMTVSFEPDCYSSTEYLNYCIAKNSFGNNAMLARNLQMNRSMDALNDRLVHSVNVNDYTHSLRRSGFQKPSTSQRTLESVGFPLHKRTHSFDSATHYAVIAPSKHAKPDSFGQKNVNQKTGALKATKNFFKRLYTNSTTLPRRLVSSKSQQKLDRFKAATSPFYEIRYPEPEEIPYLPYNIQYEVESDHEQDPDEETELDVATEEFDSSTAASCSSSTPDKSVNSRAATDEGIFSGGEDKSVSGSEFTSRSSTSGQSASRTTFAPSAPANTLCTASGTAENKFQSWNDLFGHLKKEITEMRARDQQILESLKTVESHLSLVKGLDRSRSEHSPLSRVLNAPSTVPAGAREPLRTTYV